MTDLELELAFYQQVLRHEPTGVVGRRYLQQRGITPRTAKAWGLGYAPPHVVPPGYDPTTGAARYRKLWDRIVIPVYDQHGTLVTLSGRLTHKSDERPKYDAYQGGDFNTRRLLFGLWLNHEAIWEADRVLVTEGQFDVIAAWQAKLPYVVSSFGAHCSLEQLALLARYTEHVWLLYDGDPAGRKGAQDTLALGVGATLDVRSYQPFGEGDDLDSFIRTHGTDALLQRLTPTDPLQALRLRLAHQKERAYGHP